MRVMVGRHEKDTIVMNKQNVATQITIHEKNNIQQ